MKVAVIGAGFWGKKHILEYKKLGINPIVCDYSKECNSFCSAEKLELVEHYETLLKDKELEAVSICTPNTTHIKIASDFLKAGKNVLLEKPMALNSKDAQKLVALAKKQKVLLTVGHVFRYNNALAKARAMIESGELGELYYLKLNWLNLDPVYPDRDIFFDLALHPIDIINFLLGKNPEQVFAFGEEYRKKGGEELCFITGKLGKTLFAIDASWLTPEKTRTATIVGAKKTLFIDCLSQKMKMVENAGLAATEIPVEASNSLGEELKSFLQSVEGKSPLKVSAEKGLEIITAIEAIRGSLKTKKAVELKTKK